MKCMLAEPKGKRGRSESAWSDSASPALHVRHIDTALAFVLPKQLKACLDCKDTKQGRHLYLMQRHCDHTYAKWSVQKALTGAPCGHAG